jgi:hypothetical protein
VAPLSRGLELLESAVSYALAAAARVTPPFLPRPTPCRGWDLEMLLDHVSDSIGVLHGAIATGAVSEASAPCPGPGPDPVARLRGQAVLLPIAPLLISPGRRAGLFAGPVALPGPACPGDQLVAFLGRQPRPAAASGRCGA